jgi:Arc/MetJ-type ribon-helix-helix transcriptional regulator
VEEAMPLNHSYVGTEHLLLALTRRSPEGEKQPAVVLVLEQLGLDPEHVRRQVLEVVGGRPGAGGARLGELPVALPLGPGGPLGPRPRDNVVTCRVDDHLLNALDALVEAGVYTTRSEAAARLIAAGLEANQPLMEKVYAAVAEIRRVRAQMQSLAEQLKAEPSSASREGEEPADDAPQAGL